jgi:hypothetical protein
VGSIDGDVERSFLARYRCRLLVAPFPEGVDGNIELKRHLQMWEQAHFDELFRHLSGQQVEAGRKSAGRHVAAEAGEENKGRKARQGAAANAIGKTGQGLSGRSRCWKSR